jgi:nucleotide-binding universal stress UspA family protein
MSRRYVGTPLSRVLVPVDLDTHDATAVVHGLRVALASAGSVHFVHVHPPTEQHADWSALPSVPGLLTAWGRLQDPAHPHDLLVRTEHYAVPGLDLVGAVQRAADDVLPDLIVLDTEARVGLARLKQESAAEAIARAVLVPTLFLPRRARPFVHASNGSVSLRRVVVPVAPGEDAQHAVDVAIRFVEALDAAPATFVLVHVGERDDVPQVLAPSEDPRWDWRVDVRQGSVATEIAAAVEAHDADLVVMCTHGRVGLTGALFGSHTEAVVRQARCPVLAIPV